MPQQDALNDFMSSSGRVLEDSSAFRASPADARIVASRPESAGAAGGGGRYEGMGSMGGMGGGGGAQLHEQQRVEAMVSNRVGESRKLAGTVVEDNGDGTFYVLFDDGQAHEAVPAAFLRVEVSEAEELETQMAHLRWRKMQNETKIRTVLSHSRRLHEEELFRDLTRNRSSDKAAWMRGIIEDELSKPLEVNEDFIRGFEQDQKRQRAQNLRNKRQHLKSVKNLQAQLKLRHQLAMERVKNTAMKLALVDERCQDFDGKIARAERDLEQAREKFAIDQRCGLVPDDIEEPKVAHRLRKQITIYQDGLEKSLADLEELRVKMRHAETEAMACHPQIAPSPATNKEDLASTSMRLHHRFHTLQDNLRLKGVLKNRKARNQRVAATYGS